MSLASASTAAASTSSVSSVDLSLVIADVSDSPMSGDIEAIMAANAANLTWEIILCRSEQQGSASLESVFTLWRRGINAARGRYLAILDGRCPPSAEWPAAVARELAAGVPAFFGPVICDAASKDPSMIGFVTEYVQFQPPIAPTLNEVPGNNFIFQRALLDTETLASPEFHKTFFVERLRARQISPQLVPMATVRYCKHYSFGHYLARRYAHGRNFAAHRPGTFASVFVLITPLLPALRLARIFRGTKGKPIARAALWRHLAHIALAESAWSFGEALGYLTHRGANAALLD
jgi:hypothetical protein